MIVQESVVYNTTVKFYFELLSMIIFERNEIGDKKDEYTTSENIYARVVVFDII